MVETAGRDGPLVIKWLADPAEAVDHLDRLGVDALLRMGTTNCWNVTGSMRSFDEASFERPDDVRCLATDILRLEENDRALMAPKLAVKSSATRNGASAHELFGVRARLAQIGWLETSWAGATADAILEVEYAMPRGEPEDSSSIHHQLRVFEAYEAGLVATWETPIEMICVPRLVTAWGKPERGNAARHILRVSDSHGWL
jgi:hypothetical protein